MQATGVVGLDEARERAGEYRAMLRQGIEPPKARGAVKSLRGKVDEE